MCTQTIGKAEHGVYNATLSSTVQLVQKWNNGEASRSEARAKILSHAFKGRDGDRFLAHDCGKATPRPKKRCRTLQKLFEVS